MTDAFVIRAHLRRFACQTYTFIATWGSGPSQPGLRCFHTEEGTKQVALKVLQMLHSLRKFHSAKCSSENNATRVYK